MTGENLHTVGEPVSALWHVPHSTVSEVFEDFPEPIIGHRHANHRRLNAKPVHTPENTPLHTYDEDYHVRSGFSAEQYPFIRVLRVHLNAFIRGDEDGEDGIPIAQAPFAARIIENFLTGTGGQGFIEAVKQSNLDMLKDFALAHPNFSSALRAYYVLGAQGTDLLFTPSRVLLKEAIDSYENAEEFSAFKLAAFYSFARAHAWDETRIEFLPSHVQRDYEVQCAGENIANTLYEQTVWAAHFLAQFPEVRENYNFAVDKEVPASAEEKIYQHVKDLAQEIDRKYASGELVDK